MSQAKTVREEIQTIQSKYPKQGLTNGFLNDLEALITTKSLEARMREHNLVLDKWADLGESSFIVWSDGRMQNLQKQLKT